MNADTKIKQDAVYIVDGWLAPSANHSPSKRIRVVGWALKRLLRGSRNLRGPQMTSSRLIQGRPGRLTTPGVNSPRIIYLSLFLLQQSGNPGLLFFPTHLAHATSGDLSRSMILAQRWLIFTCRAGNTPDITTSPSAKLFPGGGSAE